jgi:acetylornithine/succinyldiaminopimelate/putrescine aminotransferase
MPLDIKKLVAERLGENYALHEQYVNPTLVKVLRTIGFDKVYARAQGQYLWDKEGNRYLDMLSGYGVYNLGRNHPAVKQAIRDVLDLDLPNLVQMDCSFLSGVLAEQLIKRCPPHIQAVFFCNSGTESVEGAIKFARAATGRSKMLFLDHSFHGLSCGSLSLMGNQEFREGFGNLLPDTEAVEMNDLDALEKKLKGNDIAALVVECVQGKGINIPNDDYLPKAQALCRKYGALLVVDEVQSGLGRSGKFFCFEHWGLEPDIITVAKTLSGGYVPCAAVLTRREIYQKVYSRMDRCVVHSSSFGRNNLAMACGLAALQVIDDEQLVERAASIGEKLVTKLRALQSKHEFIKDVRGKGCMIAIEFGEPRSLKLKMSWKAIDLANKGLFGQMVVIPLMSKHRILTQVAGHGMATVRLLPPLILTDEDIEYFVSAVDDVLEDAHKLPGPMWDMGMNLAKAAISGRKLKGVANER